MKITDIVWITSSNNEYSQIFGDNLIFSFPSFEQEKIPDTWKAYANEYPYFMFCQQLDKKSFNNIKAIIIDLAITDNSENSIYIAHHIRLHKFLNNKDFNQIPIIIAHHEEINFGSSTYFGFKDLGLFKSKGAVFSIYDNLFKINAFNNEYNIYTLIKRPSNQFDFKIYIDEIEISQPQKSTRHQISNEWGAVRLARNAGFKDIEINYEYPQTLYFKYLTKKFKQNELTIDERKKILLDVEKMLGEQATKIKNLTSEGILDFSKHLYLKNKKILLIDDNADKGWKAVLSKIFEAEVESIRYMIGVTSQNKKGKCELSLKLDDYDIVLLDLYMPKFSNDKPDMKNGKKILNLIKAKYPNLPVIIFTASNKSWTFDEVFENGADGIYVKESPEFANDTEYSKANFKDFYETVLKCFNNYSILRPYWEKIVEIKSSFLPEVQDIDGGNQFKSRIEERLEMFYGLLKRGMEQKSYNKDQFFFSDVELAFITLWSLLNEISEAYYEKTQPKIWPDTNGNLLKDNSGNPIEKHPNGDELSYLNTPYRKHFKWVIKNQNDIFIEYNYAVTVVNKVMLQTSDGYYKLQYERKTAISLDENGNFVINNSLQKDESNNEQQLFMQIAFLIKKKKQLAVNEIEPNYLDNLKKLNKLRNKLYLTHGEDTGSNFYKKTEREKRADGDTKITIAKEIKDLFELVGFLLTGKNINLPL